MGRIVITENIALDGVVEADGGWFAPAGGADDADQLAAVQEQAAASGGFLTGRVTFEQMRGYWPQQSDDRTGVSAHLDRVAKYVVSRTLTDPQWANTTVLAGPLAEEIGALRERPGGDVVTTGSITLVHDLVRLGLVDEYRLFVFPVVLGRGRRLFPDGTGVPALRLLESRRFRSGVVLLRYASA
ncbi:dihydrofolate reductase family protein [Modestobacter sp. I12A-02662]|uniref:dihydrofolate reductase family protein n=1 Tax=Modestobacter sp. I12A-02662 TaxID=1730496 RepID=UPI0034DEED3A